jgi:hypothetical protein
MTKREKDWNGRMDQLAVRMDELAAAQVKTQTQIDETNKDLRELGRTTDKRIVDLVSAIGSLVTQMREQKAQ